MWGLSNKKKLILIFKKKSNYDLIQLTQAQTEHSRQVLSNLLDCVAFNYNWEITITMYIKSDYLFSARPAVNLGHLRIQSVENKWPSVTQRLDSYTKWVH